MTDLRSTLERYVNMRQGLGYKFRRQAQRLADFVSFMEKRKAVTITTKLALKWATMPPDRNAAWVLRLTAVRGFACHVASLNPKTEVPPTGILPPLKRAPSSSGSSRYRASVTTSGKCTSCPARRSRPYLPCPTGRHGSDGAITPCCCSQPA